MNQAHTTRPALWNKNFILVFISSLLMFISFYMLIPVLPMYLLDTFQTSGSAAGVVLALYTISALCIRPFSGYIVDTVSRKPLYLVCYTAFSVIFAGYAIAATLTLFIILRAMHGMIFGLATVSSSTVAVDVMPSVRRGEGIGYYGMTANIAMALGPMIGMWVHNEFSYETLFLGAFAVSILGLIGIFFVGPLKKQEPRTEEKQPLSLDRFILVKALPCAVLLFFSGLGYGAVVNYIGLYSQQANFGGNVGIFFVVVAIGIILSRVLSAKSIDRGKMVNLIKIGSASMVMSFTLFYFCSNALMLYLVGFLLGLGFGFTNPSIQTMFINLAEHNQRGTANATYFTFWDLGIGIGTAVGGVIIERFSFDWLYAICAVLTLLGAIVFLTVSVPYFQRHRLR